MAAAAAAEDMCSNGRFLAHFNPNRPKRRRMATSKHGDWVVFVDQIFDPISDNEDDYAGNPDRCFLWNELLQLKVQLPCLEEPIDTYFKCIVVSCGLSLSKNQQQYCHYKVCLFQKCWARYDWNSDEFNFWEEEIYSEDDEEFFHDAYISESSTHGDDDDSDINSRLFGITALGLFYGQNLRIQFPGRSAVYMNRKFVFQNSKEGNRLFLLERRRLCAWDVWEMDFANGSWVSVSNLDAMVILMNGYHSTVYSCKLKGGRLEGNCICYVEPGDKYNFYLYSLADKTRSIFENRPHSDFPVWFPSASNPGMLWLCFVEDGLEKITPSEDPGEIANELTPFCIDESCGLVKVFHELSHDLKSLVAESISSPLDYANFRLVCKLWSELARPIRWLPNLSSSGSIEFPWLICLENKACSIIDPTCNMKYYKSNQELSGCKIRYSKDGWLLVTRGMRDVFFIEPFTETKITLPVFPEDFDPDDMPFSSSPTSSDWVIISIVYLLTKYRLMYLKPADDEWSIVDIELSESGFMANGSTLVFHDHKFYYVNRDGDLATFWWEADVLKYSVSTIIQSTDGEEGAFKDFRRGYLVSCEESLFLVVVGLMGRLVEVFRWDVGSSKWNRIETLGNYSFFVSDTSTLAVPIREKSKQSTINFPLFVEDHHLSYKLDASEFRYSNGDISTCSRSLYQRKEVLNATWVQPKLIRGYN